MSGEMLYKVISNYDLLKHKIHAQSGVTVKAPKITLKDGEIAFSENTASQIYAKYRAISHQEFIRAKLCNNDRIIILLEILNTFDNKHPTTMSISDFKSLSDSAPIGATFYEKSTKILWIKSLDGSWIPVRRFRIEGKSQVFETGGMVSAFGLKNFKKSYFK
jgi:hypothetical protein